MNISELEPNKKIPMLVATITKLETPTETPNGMRVQEGIIVDDTGQVKISLWDDQSGAFKVEDKIILKNGYCKMFQDELQATSGKFGKIEKIPPQKPEQ